MRPALTVGPLAAAVLAAGWAAFNQPATARAADVEGTNVEQTVHSFTAADIDGREVRLSEYRGKVLLIVNVASRCGFTGQYEGLQALYARFRDRGLVVLGFPSNEFLGQEPGSNEQIKTFCSTTYGVTFPMFSKTNVKGSTAHPLYAWLTDKTAHPDTGGKITWNFNKFLVGRDGRVVARYGSRTTPDDAELVAAVERALAAAEP